MAALLPQGPERVHTRVAHVHGVVWHRTQYSGSTGTGTAMPVESRGYGHPKRPCFPVTHTSSGSAPSPGAPAC